MRKPQLVIIAGPNGSGKTALTTGGELEKLGIHLPQCYINPDNLARIIREGDTTKTQGEIDWEAWSQARELRRGYREQGVSFAFETVFSHPSSLLDMQKCREADYEVIVAYVVTERVEINLDRIEKRVLQGGHMVKEPKVRERYDRCLLYLPRIIEEASQAIVFDSTQEGQMIVRLQKRRFPSNGELPDFLEQNLGSVLRLRAQQRRDLEAQFGTLTPPNEESGYYIGPLDAVMTQFAVQRTEEGSYILHDRSLIGADLPPNHHMTIRYHLGDKKAATITDESLEL